MNEPTPHLIRVELEVELGFGKVVLKDRILEDAFVEGRAIVPQTHPDLSKADNLTLDDELESQVHEISGTAWQTCWLKSQMFDIVSTSDL